MGKRKQQLMTGMTEEQRIKSSIERKEEERKEKARHLAKVIAIELERRKQQVEAITKFSEKNPIKLRSVKER